MDGWMDGWTRSDSCDGLRLRANTEHKVSDIHMHLLLPPRSHPLLIYIHIIIILLLLLLILYCIVYTHIQYARGILSF